jgi:phosphoserine phosphatase
MVPTPLQATLERYVRDRLAVAARQPVTSSSAAFEAPFFNPGTPELVRQLEAPGTRVWLFPDGAQFWLGDAHGAFEGEYFANDAELIEAFRVAFEAALVPDRAV